jgi:hypothetical protein
MKIIAGKILYSCLLLFMTAMVICLPFLAWGSLIPPTLDGFGMIATTCIWWVVFGAAMVYIWIQYFKGLHR